MRATDEAGRSLELRGAVMLACGGFEGSAEMQARYYGDRSRFIRPVARGGYYNKGEGIRMALNAGAASCGDFTEYHAEPIDPRSGQSEPIVFNFPYGILVNRDANRFVDEASDAVDAIYENIARIISRQVYGKDTEVAQVKAAAAYLSAGGHLDADDVEDQVRWYKANGFVDASTDPKTFLDPEFIPFEKSH